MKKETKDECHVWLSMPQLHAKVIAKHCREARKAGYKKLMFIFGDVTQVSFTIIL